MEVSAALPLPLLLMFANLLNLGGPMWQRCKIPLNIFDETFHQIFQNFHNILNTLIVKSFMGLGYYLRSLVLTKLPIGYPHRAGSWSLRALRLESDCGHLVKI